MKATPSAGTAGVHWSSSVWCSLKHTRGARAMSIFDNLTNGWDFLPADPDPPTCPECGGDLEEAWVRSPSQQDHWRGVRALQCEDCDHVERPPDE